jgi:hypothetical protein
LNKSGASLSIGHRGFWYTVGPRGRRATVGLPGSGVIGRSKFHQARRSGIIIASLILVIVAALAAIY